MSRIHVLETVTRYHESVGVRTNFEWMMGEAAQDAPTLEYIASNKPRNFSWSLDDTELCRDRLTANGVSLVSTVKTSR